MPPADTPSPFPDSTPQWRPSRRQVVAGRVRFVGTLDGPQEQDFKITLLPVLRGDTRVSAAYLAQMKFNSGGESVMTLCVKVFFPHDEGDSKLSDQIFAIFRPTFEKGHRLHLAFIDAEQEQLVRNVCPAFYERKDRLDSPEAPRK